MDSNIQRACRNPLLPQFTSSLNSSYFTLFSLRSITKASYCFKLFPKCEMSRGGSSSQKYQYATKRLLLTIFYLEAGGGVCKDDSANNAISFERHLFVCMMLMC